jgi:hypothetical protein
MVEIDEVDYIIGSAYDELLEEGYEEDDIEDAIEYALIEAKVTFGHDTAPEKKRSGLLDAARKKLAGAKKSAKAAVARGARKVAKGALGVARKMEGGSVAPKTAERKPSTYRGAGAGTKEKVSSGSYTPSANKKAEKPADPWEGSATTPLKAKPKAKPKVKDRLGSHAKSDEEIFGKPGSLSGIKTPSGENPKVKATTKTAKAPARKRKVSKLDSLLTSIRNEETRLGEAVYGQTPAKKEEPKDTRYTVTAADKKGNTAAYQNYKSGDKRYKAAPHLGEENEIDEGMTMKDFKANRQKNKRRSASADAEKRGHVGKEWYNSGRKYSPDEAKRSRANMDDEERRTRHRSAVDPDSENDDSFSADKTKNPKKLRKQKALGELGENVSSGSARRARFGVKQRVSSAEPITNTQRQNKIAQHFSDHATKKKSAGDEAHAAATKAGKSPSDAETARQRAHREYEKQLKRG